MTGRTNVGGGGTALNANIVEKIVAPENNIVAGDFVQYYTQRSAVTFPYVVMSRTKIYKLDNTHYITHSWKYLYLMKKVGSVLSLIQTFNATNIIRAICIDTTDSSIIYALSISNSNQFIEVYKYANEGLTLIESVQASSSSTSAEGTLLCLGDIGSNRSVLLTVGTSSSSGNYFSDYRLYKRTSNAEGSFSYTLWRKTSIQNIESSTNGVYFPNYANSGNYPADNYIGIVKDGEYFYIVGNCAISSHYYQTIAKFHIDSSTGEVTLDISKIYSNSYNSSALTAYGPFILNDKIVWTVQINSSQSPAVSILMSRKDTLEISVLLTGAQGVYVSNPTKLFDTNKIIFGPNIYQINSENYQITKIFTGSIINDVNLITDDGYIIEKEYDQTSSTGSVFKVYQLTNEKSEFYNVLNVDYVKQWTTSGAAYGQPLGVAKDSGSAGETIGVYIPQQA